MENTHPNVTQRKGETLSGEEITHDNLPAETTALPNTSQPLGISQAQLEALTNPIGETIGWQVNSMLSAFERKLLAQIEHDASSRGSGRSRTSSEARSRTSHDDDEGDVPPEDSREVGEGEDNNDEEDPRSEEGSESSSSDEQGAPNPQQRTPGSRGGDRW